MKFIEDKNIFFYAVDSEDDLSLHLRNLVEIKPENYPSIWLLDMSGQDDEGIKKYRFEGSISSKEVREFVSNWKEGKLTPY